MEGAALARNPAQCLQARKAHLPSGSAGRYEGSPPASTAPDEVALGTTAGGEARDPGQSRQADRWHRWREEPLAIAEAATGAQLSTQRESTAGAPRLDPETRWCRSARAG